MPRLVPCIYKSISYAHNKILWRLSFKRGNSNAARPSFEFHSKKVHFSPLKLKWTTDFHIDSMFGIHLGNSNESIWVTRLGSLYSISVSLFSIRLELCLTQNTIDKICFQLYYYQINCNIKTIFWIKFPIRHKYVCLFIYFQFFFFWIRFFLSLLSVYSSMFFFFLDYKH